MNRNFLKIFWVLSFVFLFGCGFFIQPAKAESGLVLEITKECDVQYSGDSCVAELKLTNNAGKVLDGEASLHIDYQGVCSGGILEDFDGEGIGSQFFPNDSDGLNFSNWENGTVAVSGFKIAEDESQLKLKIKTAPNLCPGEYTFTLTIKGTATETEETYTAGTVIIGGGGGGFVYSAPTPTIPMTKTGEVVATPREGGITGFANPDGSEINLTVPAGAISENTVFTISMVDINAANQPEAKSNLFLIAGLVYKIKAQRDGELITTFNKPITLTFHYTDEQIEGLDESSLKIYYWEEGQNQWIALENSEVNVDNNAVTASIDHFTIFALMGSKIGFVEEKAKEEEKPAKEIGISERIKEIPKRITEEIKKVTEGITPSAPTAEVERPSVPKKVGLSEKETVPAGGEASRGDLASMLAAMGMTWGEISKSAFLTIVVILCLVGLILIGIKEWRLFQKKKKQ